MIQKVNGKLMLTDAFYSFGKKFVQVYLPAFSALYFGLGNLWGFPAVDQVVGSCAIFATFFGVCLGISSKNYESSEAAYDGSLVVGTNPESGSKVVSLELHPEAEKDIDEKTSLSFKVKEPASPPKRRTRRSKTKDV